jgi:hypothetical protein
MYVQSSKDSWYEAVRPLLKWNERRHYDFGEINWEEFWNVVNGNGQRKKDWKQE